MVQRGVRGQRAWVLLSVVMLILVTASHAEDRRSDGDLLLRPVKLPAGTVALNDDDRELSMNKLDPTGFRAKFHACSASGDHTEVLLEVCLDYQNGVGDDCGIYFVEHAEWFRFHYNYTILQMLGDFCGVCEEKCGDDHKTKPRICFLPPPLDASYDNFCGTYCDAKKRISMQNVALKPCEFQQEKDNEYQAHQIKTCPTKNYDDRNLLDVEEDYSLATTNEEALRCPLLQWWDDRRSEDSCEFVYGSSSEALADVQSAAWLRCAFDNEEQGDEGGTSNNLGAWCQGFFRQLAPCDGRGWSTKIDFEQVLDRAATMSPTSATCQEPIRPTGSPIPVQNTWDIPHFVITEAPKKAPHKETEKLSKTPEAINKAMGATTHGILLFVVVGLAGGLVAWKLRSSRALKRRSSEARSLSVVHGPVYHQVLKMNDLPDLSA